MQTETIALIVALAIGAVVVSIAALMVFMIFIESISEPDDQYDTFQER